MSPRASRQPKVRPPDPNALHATWRLFLAVPLSPAVQSLVAEQIASLQEEGWPVRWVQPESVHLTIFFLGETDREHAELVRLALPAVVRGHAAFALRTAAFGVFPNFNHPRVLWLGLHGPVHRLETLAQSVREAVVGLGFPDRTEPYHPHITLGRVRNNDDGALVRLRQLPAAVKARFVDTASGAAIAPPSEPVPIQEVLLLRSHLSKDGPRYETLASFSLGGQETGVGSRE